MREHQIQRYGCAVHVQFVLYSYLRGYIKAKYTFFTSRQRPLTLTREIKSHVCMFWELIQHRPTHFRITDHLEGSGMRQTPYLSVISHRNYRNEPGEGGIGKLHTRPLKNEVLIAGAALSFFHYLFHLMPIGINLSKIDQYLDLRIGFEIFVLGPCANNGGNGGPYIRAVRFVQLFENARSRPCTHDAFLTLITMRLSKFIFPF